MSSPCKIAACTGAAPRHAGRREKCRLTQPCGATPRRSDVMRLPYATTGMHSGCHCRKRSRTSSPSSVPGFKEVGLTTGRACFSASAATGDGCMVLPRPFLASGRVITPTTSWPESIKCCNATTAGSGVPAKTMRTDAPFLGLPWLP